LSLARVRSISLEGAAEKTFRKFDTALLNGEKKIIQNLILYHKDAKILWSGSYPKSAASKLNEISSNQPIKSIPILEDGKIVKIIAQGWPFAIEMNSKNGKWKINADKIIELRKANQDDASNN